MRAVNSVTVSEKNLPIQDNTVASIISPAAVLAPPAQLQSSNVSYRAAATQSNGQSVYSESSETESIINCTTQRQMNGVDSSSVSSRLSSSSEDNNVRENVIEKREANDFIFGKLIGEGSFSTVYLAKDIHTNKEYAIKVCRKSHIIREKKVEHIKREKEILSLLSCKSKVTAPFFVKLYCTFQDKIRLYFALSYAKNGELLSHINKVGSFDTACTKFYSAEILHALEHMHSLGIVHRDLKPENILLDEKMHIQITDFGSAKIIRQEEETSEGSAVLQRRNSFVGTAQYISPELLTDTSECTRSSDLWAFGAIIYQMVAGLPPFRSNSEYLIFKQIKNLDYDFPDGFCACAKDLVQRLLVVDPMKRLGAEDGETYLSIRTHPFFNGIDFETLYKQTPPQIYPYLPGTSDHEELRSHYRVPDHLEPGLDDRQITRLLGLELQGTSPPKAQIPEPPVEKFRKKSGLGLDSLTQQEIEARLSEQRVASARWHSLCEGNLILKQGLVDKRKGLFARRRMLLLTLGPHLYYADPVSMVLKGEIPWSEELRVEPKNFKIFFVHTPNRTYYLEDPEGYALEWCKAIEEVRVHTYDCKKVPLRMTEYRT
ncbi:UNVERIFIED_CONTAM: hypothetical protein PYX00_007900 [Menopon gallinae]|uniref:3-phosphoinositide-dependent protein kinase 1 n=1 Tax=Menopon gallinae TaxID=328185 RepID=A0AAW2HKT0_9NEOP